jgi:hypothetical protein
MTPPTELARCSNCDGWFTEGSLDDLFYHATACCRRDRPAADETFPG